MENHAEEEMEIFTGQRLGKVHSLCIDEEVWLKEELKSSKLEVEEGEHAMISVNVNSMQKSDYPWEESKNKFIHESFKIDEMRKLFV